MATKTKTPRATWWNDKDSGCWRYTAPDGYCFDGDLHEYVYDYHWNTWTAREARADAVTRGSLEPCTRPDCDWCQEEAAG